MSLSLVRQALNDIEKEEEKESTKKYGMKSSARKLEQSARHKKRKGDSNIKLKSSIKDLKMKCVLDEFKKKRVGDNTDSNLSFLLQISGATADVTVAKKVMSHQGRAQSEPAPKKVEEKSVFTEEDFEKFEKEYFVKW